LEIEGVSFETSQSTSEAELEAFNRKVVCAAAVVPNRRHGDRQVVGQTMMIPPFKFNVLRNSIVSANRWQVALPNRLAYVLKALAQAEPLSPKCNRSFLSYAEVSTLYKEGWIEDYHGGWPQIKKDAELMAAKEGIERNPRQLAHEFARQLSEVLEKNGVDKDHIFCCDEANRSYKAGSGWHPTKPLLNASEPGLFYSGDPEKHGFRSSKKPAKGPGYEDED
jgi:hypothetical protein